MQIYNIQINPELAKLELGWVKLVHTGHARARAVERHMPLPHVMNISAGSIVEVEAEGRKMKKLVVRFQGENNQDNVYVLFHDFGNLWSVLSCYQNDRDDNHATLNLAKLRRVG